MSEDVTVVACVGTNRSLMLDVQKRDSSSKTKTLGSLSVGSANQRLILRASGCLESLTAAEVNPKTKCTQIFTLYRQTLSNTVCCCANRHGLNI